MCQLGRLVIQLPYFSMRPYKKENARKKCAYFIDSSRQKSVVCCPTGQSKYLVFVNLPLLPQLFKLMVPMKRQNKHDHDPGNPNLQEQRMTVLETEARCASFFLGDQHRSWCFKLSTTETFSFNVFLFHIFQAFIHSEEAQHILPYLIH